MNITSHEFIINRENRERIKNQKALTIWIFGLSGAGKSTISNLVEIELNKLNLHTYSLDGDNTRLGLNKDLGFSEKDRNENIRRVSEVCKLMNDAGLIVISTFITPFKANRDLAKSIIGDNFVEIFLDTNIEVCEERDPKGLYKMARRGDIKEFTGISSPFEYPKDSIIIKNNNIEDIDINVKFILELIKNKIK
jgi:adenylylsulfate kinase